MQKKTFYILLAMFMPDYKSISIKDYTYNLPDKKIAKYPLAERQNSKLLLFEGGNISHTHFYRLANELPAGGLLVFNNTKVVQARLIFRKPTGARIEIFCLQPAYNKDFVQAFAAQGQAEWECIVGNQKKWKDGALEYVVQTNAQTITITAERTGQNDKYAVVRFAWNSPTTTFAEILELIGNIPIPPYLNRDAEDSDKTTYQTVYSEVKGSVAAPTAGLHFTPEILAQIEAQGTRTAALTLHVGAGTFVPVKADTIGGHDMHTEYFVVNRRLIQQLLSNENKITAVGTTSSRTLESLYWMGVKVMHNLFEQPFLAQWEAYTLPQNIPTATALQALDSYMQQHELTALHAATQIIIVPPYRFRIVNHLITNFHQPESTLLLLIAAFAGKQWRSIYNYALDNDFRFLSYGDSSLLKGSVG